MRNLRSSGDDINGLHMLSECCRWQCGCSQISLVFENCWKLQFGCPILHSSLTIVVGRVPPSRLRQFIKPHLLLLNTLHAVLDGFGHWTHHPAGFVIFAQLMQLWIFSIILIFTILLIAGTYKIAQTVSDSIQHLLKCFLRLFGCQYRFFNISHTFLLLPDRRLCILNSPSCHSGVAIHIILDPFLILCIASKVHSLSFLCWKLHVRS